MDKLLIVDGSNLLFQMFYGMPARITGKDGRPIQGTLGFVGALLKILRMVQPTHAVVLFDGECHNPRTDLDENYKANRPDYEDVPEEELPFSQLPDIFRALDVLNLRYAETTECETDDWIAGYALNCDCEVVISSFDSDFFQLINDRVTVLRYRGNKTVICDRAYIREKLEIEPEQYAFFKSLTGDTADNIPGVPKVGPKTAAALLTRFGSLEALIASAETIRQPSIRASVATHAERIRTNYRLILLENGAALPYPIEALTYYHNGMTTGEVLQCIGLK